MSKHDDFVISSASLRDASRERITALETALAAMTAERDESGRRLGEFELRLAGALIASEGGNGCPDGAIECIRTCPTIASVMRLRAERDARDVAIGVLAKAYHATDQYIAWQGDMQHADAMTRASLVMLANPIARAAVEGER